MKIRNCLLAAMLLFAGHLCMAQTSRAGLLTGKWNVESLTPEFPKTATAKEKEKGMKEIAGDLKNFKATGFTFTKDGKLSVDNKTFEWSFLNSEKEVSVTKGKKEIALATIVELTEHKLVFTRLDEGMVVTCVLSR